MLARVVSFVLTIAAAVLLLTGWTYGALAALLLSLVAQAVADLQARRDRSAAPPVHLTDSDAADARRERAEHGEMTAIRGLRTRHPDLSLLDAVTFVRGLE